MTPNTPNCPNCSAVTAERDAARKQLTRERDRREQQEQTSRQLNEDLAQVAAERDRERDRVNGWIASFGHKDAELQAACRTIDALRATAERDAKDRKEMAAIMSEVFGVNPAHHNTGEKAMEQCAAIFKAKCEELENTCSERDLRYTELETAANEWRARFYEQAKEMDAAKADSERLDAVYANRWTLTWNQRHWGFIIQRIDQVVGNIGHGADPRTAIDQARAGGASEV